MINARGAQLHRRMDIAHARTLARDDSAALLALPTADGAVFVILITSTDSEAALLAASFNPEPHG
jgi:hypothetical protein